LIEIGSKTAEKNSAQTNRQKDRQYKNNGHLAVNQKDASFAIKEQCACNKRETSFDPTIATSIQTETSVFL